MTELVFILDRSGSMSGLEKDTIGGFNSMLEKQRKEPGDAVISTVLFDNETDVIHDRISLDRVPALTEKEYYVRGTYTKYNLDFSNDVFDLLEHGFDQISVEPVMADENDPYAITEADLPAIFKEYEVLMNKILDYEKNGFTIEGTKKKDRLEVLKNG